MVNKIVDVIKTENLTEYYSKNRGIEEVSFSIQEGEIFGFIGPNGVGKTTTIRLLLGLIFSTSGKAMVFGKDSVKDGREIRVEIGYIPGEVNFYPDATVENFLRYSASLVKRLIGVPEETGQRPFCENKKEVP